MNEITFTIDGKIYRLTNMNNNNKYDRAMKDAGINATPKQILAHYDKHAGYIQDENGNKIINGKFWEEEKLRLRNELNDLVSKSDDELEAIIRRAENTDVAGSLFQRARLELEMRDRKRSMEKVSGNLDTTHTPVLKKYRDEIIVGVVVTVVGGLILAWIL